MAGGVSVICLSIGRPRASSAYMVKCVCTSIRPGRPVYLERSIVSTPAGIVEASVVTERILPPLTITIAFVQTLPLASHNLPKRTALMFLPPGLS